MNMRIGRVLAISLVAVMLCSLSGAYAYEGSDTSKDESRSQAHFKKMTEELKLTPQQQEQITKDREQFAAKSKDLRGKMKTVREDLKTELDKPVPDVTRVNGLVAQMKDLVGAQIQSKVDKIMVMKRVLTPEQFKKMGESMKNWKHGKDAKGDKSDKHCGKGGDPACVI